MTRVEKAIENLQAALNPVELETRITATQIAKQIELYMAAATEYEAAYNEIRNENLANGPKPEYVKSDF